MRFSTAPRRGQSLVLACLSLLALTLMVMLSLSLSARVREKAEMDTVSSAAAYSEAVATARTYNSIALMNRAIIAHWLDVAGVESLISWTMMYVGYSLALDAAVTKEVVAVTDWYNSLPSKDKDCAQPIWAAGEVLDEAVFEQIPLEVGMDYTTFVARWQADAAKAGDQGRKIQDAIMRLSGAESGVYDELRAHAVGEQLITQRVISDAWGASHFTPVSGAAGASDAILGAAHQGGGDSSDKVWWAVMDQRPGFVKNRNDNVPRISKIINDQLAKLFAADHKVVLGLDAHDLETVTAPYLGGLTVDIGNRTGNSCFGASLGSCEGGPDWTNALAQDSVDITLTFNKLTLPKSFFDTYCPGDTPAFSGTFKGSSNPQLLSSDLNHDDDTLIIGQWQNLSYGNLPGTENIDPSFAIKDITMDYCLNPVEYAAEVAASPGKDPCHSVNVPVYGLDTGPPLNGQPKLYAGVQRDTSQTNDAWDMRTKISFSKSGPGETIDFKTRNQSTSLAAGLAYYHRPGAFTETPNLFNPYWRATLIGVDRAVPMAITGLPAAATDAVNDLHSKGYLGEKYVP